MIIDNNLVLDTAAAITTTRDSTNVIDLTVAEDIGDGEFLEVIVMTQTGFTTGASTLTVAFEGSTDSTTYTIFDQSDAIAVSSLTSVGVQIYNCHVPMRRLVTGNAFSRYIKLVYTCSATIATGKVTAWIGSSRQTNAGKVYSSGFTVVN